MRIFALLFFILFQVGFTQAQTLKDSLEKKYKTTLYDTSIDIAEGVLEAIKSRRFESMKPYIPTLEYMQLLVDSVDSTNLLAMARIRQQYHLNTVRKEFATLLKDAKKYNVNLKTIEIEDRVIKHYKHDYGGQYAEVFYTFKKGDKRYLISFIAVELVGYWFVGDQLRLELMF